MEQSKIRKTNAPPPNCDGFASRICETPGEHGDMTADRRERRNISHHVCGRLERTFSLSFFFSFL